MNNTNFTAYTYFFFGLAFALTVIGGQWIYSLTTDWYFSAFVAINFVTIFLYWLDKRLSKLQGKSTESNRNSFSWPRIPNNFFHILALLGGFIGGWMGRKLSRHKLRDKAESNKFGHRYSIVYPLFLLLGLLIHTGVIAIRYANILE